MLIPSLPVGGAYRKAEIAWLHKALPNFTFLISACHGEERK